MTYTPKSYSHYTVLCRILDKPITDNWATFALTNEEAKSVEEKGLLSMLCKEQSWMAYEEHKAWCNVGKLPKI